MCIVYEACDTDIYLIVVLRNKPLYPIDLKNCLRYLSLKAPKINIVISDYRYLLQYWPISVRNGTIGNM